MNKKIISIIASFSIIMCMVSPSNGYAKESESDVVVFHDIAYMTITDHYSKAEHSGSYDVSWSENGRYETYTIDVQCINKDDKAPEIYVEISLSDRKASDALRHLLGNIKYCSEDVTLVEYDTEDTLHCIADGLSTNGRANSFLTVMNDYKYEYGIKPDATTFAVFSVNNPNLTPMVSIDVLGTEFNVNTVLSDSSSQYTIIQQLEEENSKLKNQIDILSSEIYGDATGDGEVNVEDSMWTLTYYTEHDVAHNIQETFLDWCLNRRTN